jgi:hypothetical protein
MATNNPAVPAPRSPTGGTQGRSSSTIGNGNRNSGPQEASASCCSRQASVVIRATVEHIGLVGDTEMQVTVKWPASTFCAPPCEHPVSEGSSANETNVPANSPEAPLSLAGVVYADSHLASAQKDQVKGSTTARSETGYRSNASGSNGEHGETDHKSGG